MKDLMKKIPTNLVVIVVLFVVGCFMLSTVTEPTYDELLNPIPFIGMLSVLASIVWVFIADITR